jgi:hypothetical protein
LTDYEAAQNPNSQDPREIARHDLLLIRLLDLNLFFGAKTVGDIKAQLCRRLCGLVHRHTERKQHRGRDRAAQYRVRSDSSASGRMIYGPRSMPIMPSTR